MRRRDLLKSMGAGYGAVAGAGPAGGRPPSRPAGDRPTERAQNCPPTNRSGSTDPTSLRDLGEKMDPERPARALRGNGAPYGRGSPPSGAGPDEWSGDASHLVLKRDVAPDERSEKGVRESVAKNGAYDFGMAHRTDKGLVEAHRYTRSAATASGGRSMRELVDRHRNGTECKWLVYNTWLAPAQFFSKPIPNSDRKYRKDEVGTVIRAESYDVALLNEVFHGNHWTSEQPGKAIRKNAGTVVHYERGPDRGTDLLQGQTGKIADSGLLALTLDNSPRRTPRIVDHAKGTFDDLSGQDTPANKGWLYVEVDVGPGNLDVFLTHANSQQERDTSVLVDDHFAVREKNVRTVLDAVATHEESGNVTVVCGDINVRGDFDQYDWLLRKMRTEGLDDAYLTRGGIETSTSYVDDDLVESSSVGHARGCNAYTEKCHRHRDLCHCDDYRVADGSANTRGGKYVHHNRRLDYVFVEEPRSSHTFDLDLVRMRRRIFPRYPPINDPSGTPRRCGPTYSVDVDQNQDAFFLSDHLGLEMHTVASKR